MWKCSLNSYFLFFLVFWGCFILSTNGENNVVRENKLTGTTAWWYPQRDIIPPIQGFTTRISYSIGNMVIFKVKTEPWIGVYSIAVFRLGYYNATGARLVANFTVQPTQQPPCNFEVSSRMTDCMNWQVSAQWQVPVDAVSGVYVALPMFYNTSVTAAYGSYIPFIVRQSTDQIGSDLLFKTSDLTWAAYNKYGSWNVYRGNGSFYPSSRATQYSYNRPWQNRLLPPEGQGINFVFGAEFAMLYWLEQHGFDVSYCSCADLENMYADNLLVPAAVQRDDTLPLPYKVLLSVGHDEYWTPALRKAFEQAREYGVHLGFFSGNEVFWRVRWWEDSSAGAGQGSTRSSSSTTTTTTTTSRSNDNINSSKAQRTGAVIARRRRYLRSRHAGNGDRASTGHSTAATDTASSGDNNKDIDTNIDAGYDPQRIVVCRKETLDDSAPATPEDWTGTFRDPRYRPAEEESRLTGQNFMVNAHRWDALSVTREDAALRFWRHASFALSYSGSGGVEQRSDQAAGQVIQCRHANASRSHRTRHTHREPLPDAVVYTSAEGVLGYEWDAFPQRARPAGLFPLSTTHKHVDHHLLVQYGAAYSGAGTATHRLSMYRYHRKIEPIGERANRPRDALMQQLCRPGGTIDAQSPTRRSSLVFGVGTVQWSWALSDRHDGRQMPPDRDLQQATLNVFADMGVFPATLHSTGASDDPCMPQLAMPSSSTDLEAPTSKITSVDVRNVSAFAAAHWLREGFAFVQALRVRGTAEDRGGGQVAAVEVSVDGGRTWAMAVGRRAWHYSHYFVNSSHSASSDARSTDTAEESLAESLHTEGVLYGGDGQEVSRAASVLVISRAVDDSGWLEQPSVAAGLCAAAHRDHQLSGAAQPSRRAVRIAGTRIVHSNALLVQLQEL